MFISAIVHCRAQRIIIEKIQGESEIISIDSIKSIEVAPPIKGPAISAPDQIDFGLLKCTGETGDTVITISNAGERQLQITHVAIIYEGDFYFTEDPPLIFGLDPGESQELSIGFDPEETGEKSAKLRITSNAISGAYYDIPLAGAMQQTSFDIDRANFDLGTVCPNNIISRTIEVVNTGTGPIDIALQGDPSIMEMDEITIEKNCSKSITIKINTGSELGNQSSQAIFTDDCGNHKSAKFQWTTAGPKLVCGNKIEMTAKTGDKSTMQITLLNESATTDLTITEAEYPNSHFYFEEGAFPLTIQKGGNAILELIYEPRTAAPTDAMITLYGEPCNYSYSLAVKGDPENVEYLINEDFEKYTLDEFPYSSGWIMHTIGGDISGKHKVTNTVSKSGDQSLEGWGFYDVGQGHNYTLFRYPVDTIPEVLYAEVYMMTDHIGYCGLGFSKMSGSNPGSAIAVIFEGHGRMYYVIGSESGVWPNNFYDLGMWIKMRIKYERELQKTTIYVNDQKMKEVMVSQFSDEPFDSFYLRTGGGYPGWGITWFDDVKVWYEKE
jgi:hypothetical protein